MQSWCDGFRIKKCRLDVEHAGGSIILTRFKRFTLETYVVAMVAIAIDAIILAPALPFVMSEYHVPIHWGVWTISLHLAVFSMALPVMENAAMSIGRMKILHVALGLLFVGTWMVFTVKSWVCLMCGRIIQAVGIGGAIPYISVQVRRIMAQQNRQWQSMAMLVLGSTVASIPWLVSGLIKLLGWRFAFLFHGLGGVALFVVSRRWVCSDRPQRMRVTGGASIFFFGLILFFVMAGLTKTDLLGGWPAIAQPDVLPLWIMGVGMIVPLLMVERQKSQPFFEPHLFANWRFWLLYGQAGLSGFIWTGFVLIPFWAAYSYGFDHITAGALFCYLVLCSLFALSLVQSVARAWGFRWTAVFGYGLSALSFLALALNPPFVWSFTAFGLLSFGLSFVLAAPVHQPLFAWVPNRRMRSGMMALGMFRVAGGAIGLLTVSRIFTAADTRLLFWTADMALPSQVVAAGVSSVYWFSAFASLAGIFLSMLVRFQRPVL
jgi:MFS family permease